MLLKYLTNLRGQSPFIIQTVNMSQRQARKFPPKPIIRTVIHKEMIEENIQQEYEEAVKKDGKLTKNEAQALQQQNPEKLFEIQKYFEAKDLPVPGLVNPYEKPAHRCMLCEHDVHLDYKNVRLLSQFVSSHTGMLYGPEKTGLCIYMQNRITQLIYRSRKFGYMPLQHKIPEYVRDPKLFDPFSGPFRKRPRRL